MSTRAYGSVTVTRILCQIDTIVQAKRAKTPAVDNVNHSVSDNHAGKAELDSDHRHTEQLDIQCGDSRPDGADKDDNANLTITPKESGVTTTLMTKISEQSEHSQSASTDIYYTPVAGGELLLIAVSLSLGTHGYGFVDGHGWVVIWLTPVTVGDGCRDPPPVGTNTQHQGWQVRHRWRQCEKNRQFPTGT